MRPTHCRINAGTNRLVFAEHVNACLQCAVAGGWWQRRPCFTHKVKHAHGRGTIMAAVERARPGDTVTIAPGFYMVRHQRVMYLGLRHCVSVHCLPGNALVLLASRPC